MYLGSLRERVFKAIDTSLKATPNRLLASNCKTPRPPKCTELVAILVEDFLEHNKMDLP